MRTGSHYLRQARNHRSRLKLCETLKSLYSKYLLIRHIRTDVQVPQMTKKDKTLGANLR